MQLKIINKLWPLNKMSDLSLWMKDQGRMALSLHAYKSGITGRKSRKKKSKKRKIIKREPFNYNGFEPKDLVPHLDEKLERAAVELRDQKFDKFQNTINEIVNDKLCIAACFYAIFTNKGYRTKGFSNYMPITREQYAKLVDKAYLVITNPNDYTANPLQRFDIDKPKGGTRPLSVPSYLDRLLQRVYAYILEVIYEEISEPHSFGFRRFRSPGWAAKEKALAINNRRGYGCPKFAYEIDLKKYFDSIDHNWILRNLCKMTFGSNTIEVVPRNLMYQWLKCGYIKALDKDQVLTPTLAGVPQGGIISPVISNLVLNGVLPLVKKAVDEMPKEPKPKYIPNPKTIRWSFFYNNMLQFETSLNETNVSILNKMEAISLEKNLAQNLPAILKREKKTSNGWLCEEINSNHRDRYIQNLREWENKYWIHPSRFADDINILFNCEEVGQTVKKAIDDFGLDRGFSINEDKTSKRTILTEGFKFLGFQFSVTMKKDRPRAYYYPPEDSIKKVYNRIREIFYGNEYKSAETKFLKANEYLRGWLYYYCHSNAKSIFNKMAWVIWHIAYGYFWNRYKTFKRFKKDSSENYKTNLSAFIYRSNLAKDGWWYIPKSRRSEERYKDKPLFLTNPNRFRVSQPPIIIYRNGDINKSLSGFHPDDLNELRSKALQWKPGIHRFLLKEYNGQCACCKMDLLSNAEWSKFQIHHIYPPGNPKFSKKENLRPLCHLCHSRITSAVLKQNIPVINMFIRRSLLTEDWIKQDIV